MTLSARCGVYSGSWAREYVVAAGRTVSVEDFCRQAFEYVELDWREYVKVGAKLVRPAEVPMLCGDATKIKTELGWKPETSLEDLIAMMVDADLRRVKQERP